MFGYRATRDAIAFLHDIWDHTRLLVTCLLHIPLPFEFYLSFCVIRLNVLLPFWCCLLTTFLLPLRPATFIVRCFLRICEPAVCLPVHLLRGVFHCQHMGTHRCYSLILFYAPRIKFVVITIPGMYFGLLHCYHVYLAVGYGLYPHHRGCAQPPLPTTCLYFHATCSSSSVCFYGSVGCLPYVAGVCLQRIVYFVFASCIAPFYCPVLRTFVLYSRFIAAHSVCKFCRA